MKTKGETCIILADHWEEYSHEASCPKELHTIVTPHYSSKPFRKNLFISGTLATSSCSVFTAYSYAFRYTDRFSANNIRFSVHPVTILILSLPSHWLHPRTLLITPSMFFLARSVSVNLNPPRMPYSLASASRSAAVVSYRRAPMLNVWPATRDPRPVGEFRERDVRLGAVVDVQRGEDGARVDGDLVTGRPSAPSCAALTSPAHPKITP